MTAAENRNKVVNSTYVTNAGPKTVETARTMASYSSFKSPKYPTVLQQNMMQIHQVDKIRYPKPLYNSSGEVYDIFVPLYPPEPTFGSYSTRAETVLLNRLESKVHQGKVDLLTALAERKESIQMIQKRVNQAVPLIINYKRESQSLERKIRKAAYAPKKLKRLVKLLSDLRLEFSFGWAPIASDLYALGNEIMPPIFFADVTASYSEEQYITAPFGYEGDYMGGVRLKAFCQLSMSDPFSASASQIGLTDPAVTAWELVPWSFAVDWIWPLGDYLRQANMFSGLRVVASSLTVRQDGKAELVYKSGNSPMNGASSELKFKYYRRTTLPKPRLPQFMDSPFGSLTRTLNQLALLGQLVGKQRPGKV